MADAVSWPGSPGPLLATKFHRPSARAGSVGRPRLLSRLDRGLERKLTLVSAPAGFGKTTLLAEWLAHASGQTRSVAWLSLDQHDNRPAAFWSYIVAALQVVDPDFGRGTMSLLEMPPLPRTELLLTALLNEVDERDRDYVLVLDDFHLIDTPSIHEGVTFLLDHLPPSLHLVILGRSDPPLPLARLRARGELMEVRAADLRLSSDEAAAFLNGTMGLRLSAPEISALDARTEGWVAGLQLAALSLEGRAETAGFIERFAGDDRYVVDYLAEEVLERQPDDIRRFLLETSILERLSGSLCDAITGGNNGSETLAGLERGNLFVVPLDDRREWFRYHHLFADVLRAHLRQAPLDERDLHLRASKWFALQDQPSDAIHHAMAASDIPLAAGLVEREAETLVRRHQPDRLLEWLKPIPDEVIRTMPVLSTYYAHALQAVGAIEQARVRLDDAERCLDAAAEPDAPTGATPPMVVGDRAGFESLPALITLGRSYCAMASGDGNAAGELAREALAVLPEDEHHWRGAASALLALTHWSRGDLTGAEPLHHEGVARLEKAGDIVLALSSAYHGGDLLKARGRLIEAAREYERSLSVASRFGGPELPGVANLHFGFSELCSERGEIDGATQHLEFGEQLGLSGALPATAYRRALARARLAQAQGDLGTAMDFVERAEALYVRSAVPNIRPLVAWRTRLLVAQGRVAEALDWCDERGLKVDDGLDYRHEYEHLTLARVLLASGGSASDRRRLREAGQLLGRLLEAAEAGGRGGAIIEALILRAIADRALDDETAALAHLERAVTLAEPEGYVAVFVDEGEPARDLLRRGAANGIGGAYVRQLLAAFDERSGAVQPTPEPRIAGLAEPLTAREIEILRLIAVGMRNQEIADQLVISLPTVKRHIANGYGKLGATHRTEAVARATELNLL